MFVLKAEDNHLQVMKWDLLTSGAREVFTCRFQLGKGWQGLDVTAVFQAGRETRQVLLDGSGVCRIPWEVLETPGPILRVGLMGSGSGRVLPTVWAELDRIQPGVRMGPGTVPPPTDVYGQILAKAREAEETASQVREAARRGDFNGAPGPAGQNGATFRPYLDSSGSLSWTNDGGLANPQTRNIMGPKGDTGEQGPAGRNGSTPYIGLNGNWFIDGVDTGKPSRGEAGGSSSGGTVVAGENGATFTPYVDDNGNLSWSNDKGLANPQTQNIKGPKGDDGQNGSNGISVTHSWSGTTLILSSASGTTYKDLKGPKGDPGSSGQDGQSAYAAAQAGGYTGTQADFYADLAAMQNLAAELAAIYGG